MKFPWSALSTASAETARSLPVPRARSCATERYLNAAVESLVTETIFWNDAAISETENPVRAACCLTRLSTVSPCTAFAAPAFATTLLRVANVACC